MKRRELIFIVNRLQQGGAEKQLLWMARTLALEGYTCLILELQPQVSGRRLNVMIESATAAGVLILPASPTGGYISAWSRFGQVLREYPDAAIWTWGYRADVVALLQGRLIKGRRWLCALRSANAYAIRRAKWIIKLRRRKITGYVSNTWKNCEMIETIDAEALRKSRVIHNVVEELSQPSLSLPTAGPRPFRVMMLGNVDRFNKGYDLALDLGERLKRLQLGVEIHVAGRLDSGDWLPKEISRRNLSDTIIYEGETNDPAGYLRSGHAYLLMSRVEGTPNALLEAMSIGLPAIATRVGDLERLAADRKDLRLIGIGDVEAASVAIKALLDDWPDAVAMGLRGREWCFAHFNENACRKRLIELAAELVGECA
jgi:glycosyltransferase involved in cell wall biosynthesis